MGLLWEEKIGDSAWEGAGQSGKETWLPIGIWEPLLRFIGIGILRTWGIIHGKASLFGSVYKMRQGWQRWRPSTTGPSCLNMGLSHLTYPWHQLQLFNISHKTHRLKVLYNTEHNCQFLSHVVSVVWNWKVWPYGYMHIFQIPQHKLQNIWLFLLSSLYKTLSLFCSFEDFISTRWLTHFTLIFLTTVSCSQGLFKNQIEHHGSLFKKP